MNEDIIAWIILYLLLCFVLPVFGIGRAGYWEIVAGIHVLIAICALAVLFVVSLFWALAVVFS